MDDRIAEIREALDWWEDHGLARFSQREIDPVVDAAREYADLLDSDALIIRRDENGEWSDDLLDSIARETGDFRFRYLSNILDAAALASSQGVEP